MSTEHPLTERLRPKDFHFRVERHPDGRISIWDGGDQYTFILQNGQPYMSARPNKTTIFDSDHQEKLAAMMEQAAAVLREL